MPTPVNVNFALFDLFLFHDTPPTEIYTLSLHDALPISPLPFRTVSVTFEGGSENLRWSLRPSATADRKSTRLNSSHVAISYAVFCLKKKSDIKKKFIPDCIISAYTCYTPFTSFRLNIVD